MKEDKIITDCEDPTQWTEEYGRSHTVLNIAEALSKVILNRMCIACC